MYFNSQNVKITQLVKTKKIDYIRAIKVLLPA